MQSFSNDDQADGGPLSSSPWINKGQGVISPGYRITKSGRLSSNGDANQGVANKICF